MIKKLNYIALIMVFLIPLFAVPTNVLANNNENKTLRELYNELLKVEEELKRVNNDKSLTKSKINQIEKNIVRLDNEVVAIGNAIVKTEKEIVKLNENIASKDKEIKELMKFFQLSTGENMYLEYAFGASSMTDFIYRLAVVEQLTKYNNQMIDDMNNMITQQEKKTKELAAQQKNAQVKRRELSSEQVKLGDRVYSLNENSMTLSEEIADAKKTIKNYEKLGCKPNDILSVCSRVNGDVSFARPTLQGLITCGWGCYGGHRAIDIGGIAGENIYATAAGLVVDITWGSTCGGNYVTIQHKVNGKSYASRYMHMASIRVGLHQNVTKDTVLGTVGGYAGGYDRCTTGPHLHFAIANGVYGQDFWSFGSYAINPVNLINFPPAGVWFSSRYRMY
ncbi:MAG: peptidoglycan DD-metalloendopeptidase family protein [Bacilli bacterium]|nr:peptidoglycan DD-metalloendopeptidase family protein [Bacilli bacterium]